MTEQLVKIIQLHKRREKLLSVRKVANQISELKKQYELMGQYISSSDFHTATQCALYVRHVSKDPEFCEYKAVQAIRDRMYDGLPDLRRRIDKGLMR
jgi:3-methyladenine DNA glycosylase Tag